MMRYWGGGGGGGAISGWVDFDLKYPIRFVVYNFIVITVFLGRGGGGGGILPPLRILRPPPPP